jgi:hypothetical protein
MGAEQPRWTQILLRGPELDRVRNAADWPRSLWAHDQVGRSFQCLFATDRPFLVPVGNGLVGDLECVADVGLGTPRQTGHSSRPTNYQHPSRFVALLAPLSR